MKKIHINFSLNRMLLFLIGILLHNLVSGQNAYFSDRTETVLTYYGFTDDKRKELLIELSDSGSARAMYYLAEKYEHPTKRKIDLIKESAEKGFFMAECELGRRYIKGWDCVRNQDSAYVWLRKAIEHTEPFVESDKKKYQKTIKTWEGQNNLSIEIERMTTYAFANSILSQYYMEKGLKEKGLKSAKIGYEIMNKIYLAPKGWTPNPQLYKDILLSNWIASTRYMAVAYYIMGDVNKGNKIWNMHREYSFDIEDKEPWEYRVATRIHEIYRDFGVNPIAMDYYRKAVEKKSYLAMREMIAQKDLTILPKVKQLAVSGDSIAAMLYIHYQLNDEKDTTTANAFLKEIPFRFSFPYRYYMSGENLVEHILSKDDVYFLLIKDALHTDVETILRLIDRYANKFIGNTDFKKVVSLYEVLISQHPNYSPTPQLKRDVSACYYNLRDYIKAIPIMSEICDTYPDASFRIGEILYEGYLGVPDYNKAFEYLKRAENMKNDEEVSRLFYYLGMCYLKGNGVSKDEAKGFEYMKKALTCRRIYVKAFWEISKCYRFGRGVSRDLKKAEEYEEKAASYKNEDALWIREQQMQ